MRPVETPIGRAAAHQIFLGMKLRSKLRLAGRGRIGAERLAGLDGTSVFAVETLPRMLNCAVMVAAAYRCAAEALGQSPAMLSMAV
jgi:hypothetical protein